MISKLVSQKLEELAALAAQLTNSDFTRPCPALGDATIGEHMRHVIEMLQCLESGYREGRVDYDSRKRDPALQTAVAEALRAIEKLGPMCQLPNRDLILEFCADGHALQIATNFERELIYNLEHTVHHQALIRVALRDLPHVEVAANFGVARSTIEYRDQCAP